jgi:hypothetical protein
MVATTAALIAGAAAKVAAGLAAAKAAVAATAIGSKVIAGVTAVKGAIGAATTAVKGLSIVGKVGSVLGKVGSAIKATKVGGMVVKGATALGKTKIGGALVKGAKAVSGFAKAHPVATSLGQNVAQQGASSLVSSLQQGAMPADAFKAVSLTDDTASTLKISEQQARTSAYNDSVFGSSMSLANTYAGESGGSGSGIFSSLLRSKNTLR